MTIYFNTRNNNGRRNVPNASENNVPNTKSNIDKTIRNYTHRKVIVSIAKNAYYENGRGISFQDLQIKLGFKKAKAQRVLKDLHMKKVLFTATDLKSEGIEIFDRTKPQKYYPMEMRSKIIQDKKKNIPNSTTDTKLSKVDCLKAQNLIEVLSLLDGNPLYIHNMKLQAVLSSVSYYHELKVPIEPVNKAKIIEAAINQSQGPPNIKYILYANRNVTIDIINSAKPFRLATEHDVLDIMTFLGRVEERLCNELSDPRGKSVSPLKTWILTQCDVNKDVEINGLAQLSLTGLQVPLIDITFRAYVKGIQERVFYRIEYTFSPRDTSGQVLQKIRKNALINEDTVRLSLQKMGSISMKRSHK